VGSMGEARGVLVDLDSSRFWRFCYLHFVGFVSGRGQAGVPVPLTACFQNWRFQMEAKGGWGSMGEAGACVVDLDSSRF
jgi:hypothetical protein